MCDLFQLHVKIEFIDNICQHRERSQLSAVVAPSHAVNNKTFSTVGGPPDVRRVQLLDKIADVNKTKSKEWSSNELSQVKTEVGAEVLVIF